MLASRHLKRVAVGAYCAQLCLAGLAIAQNEPAPLIESLETIVVKGQRTKEPSPSASALKESDLRKQRSQTSDTARLLEDVPGVSVNTAGGISGLPAIRGLADERIRIQVDGMDLMSACPNHMNSPLSYISPTDVGAIRVFAGVTPVSIGGDSLGGSIQVDSAPPVFADQPNETIAKGQLGAVFRSNGNVRGKNVATTLATQTFSFSYRANESEASNYRAAKAFKPAQQGSETGRVIPADEVASTSFRPINQSMALAWKRDKHLLQLDAWHQKVTFEGYPNQRMDMTDNDNRSINLRYRGVFDWGTLDTKLYQQRTRHEMDMGQDRYFYGTGMPMLTKADTLGGSAKGAWALSDIDILNLGSEFQKYTIYDWWPPVGGAMGPNDFWNIDNGRRNRADAFIEWERFHESGWTSLLGVRRTLVNADASAVQGYDNGLGMWAEDAAAFNSKPHKHIDQNWDLTALARHEGEDGQTIELGLARKSRAPSLYQRYPWSTQPMAALMNNFVGDGNGYVGNEHLKSEVAHTVSASIEHRDPESDKWGVKASSHFTSIQNYVDATRCQTGQCSSANATVTNGFVLLQYANQSARIYGVDVSADTSLLTTSQWGHFSVSAKTSWLRGKNTQTGDGLYNLMPLNGKFTLTHRMGAWSHDFEWGLVNGKHRTSRVRNEMETAGYSLMNWRGTYEWKKARLNLGVENVLNRHYFHPLGGAYVGQGPSMTTAGIPWGTPVPGMGRSFNLAISVDL